METRVTVSVELVRVKEEPVWGQEEDEVQTPDILTEYDYEKPVCIKEEPFSDNDGSCSESTELCADRKVEDQLVLGPVVLQQREVLSSEKPVCVKKEASLDDTSCDVSGSGRQRSCGNSGADHQVTTSEGGAGQQVTTTSEGGAGQQVTTTSEGGAGQQVTTTSEGGTGQQVTTTSEGGAGQQMTTTSEGDAGQQVTTSEGGTGQQVTTTSEGGAGQQVTTTSEGDAGQQVTTSEGGASQQVTRLVLNPVLMLQPDIFYILNASNQALLKPPVPRPLKRQPEKPFSCDMCSKKFKYASHMARHQSMHEDNMSARLVEKRPFFCVIFRDRKPVFFVWERKRYFFVLC
ncbi:uncharacterized protein LOC134752011 [Cydia strobilella]|uniref:uncharacterized protein LOC134752011 n=1 Tax=Cydia strobilella TaxID=1100964 RepID=UPI003003B11B